MAQKKYCHLSLEERDRLAIFRAQGLSINEMARRLKRNKSTVSREVQRNSGSVYQSYGGGSADRRARQRRHEACHRERLKNPRIRVYVYSKLREGWSPEQIAGRLAQDSPGLSISHEAIYQYVYHPMIRQQENLVPYLPRAHWKRQLKGHRHTHRDPHIPERISICERPRHIERRKQLGHWENDLIISRRSPVAVNILVERKSRFTKLAKVAHHTPHDTRCAITKILSRYPKHARRSITYDNGHENLEHRQVNAVLGTASYFCEPYHSWEKGTVENTVGLVRRVFPKKTDFAYISAKDVKRLERQLNNRPRKSLYFETPKEVFSKAVALQR
jgi:IS30 family transposase